MFLVGNFQHALDDKNRIRLPSKFREILGSSYFLVPGTDGCVWLFPMSAESKYSELLKQAGEFNPANARAISAIAAMGSLAEGDSQGRFMLTPALIKFAGIGKDIRIVGSMDKVEIWSEERYLATHGELTSDDINSFYASLDASSKNK